MNEPTAPTAKVCRKCGHLDTASIHHESYTRPNRCEFETAIASGLAIRLETLAPHPDAYPTHLYVAPSERCGRCNQVTLCLRIEPVYPDVDVAGRDIDVTMHLCPRCLEQLASAVQALAAELG